MKRSIAIAVAISACHAPAPATEPRPGLDVRLARHAELALRTNTREPIELPFGQGQNGTELVVALMQQARAVGATYVGDLAFHMVFKRRGAMIECETRVLFDDELAAERAHVAPAVTAAPEPDDYSTDVASFQPHEVSFVATERELRCKQVAVTVATVERRYASRFDAEVAHQSDVIPLDDVMHSEAREACDPEQVTRNVTRFDFEAKLAYVPPDWTYLAPTYAHDHVVEAPPLCYAIDPAALGDHPVHRLTATLGFRGPIQQLEPLDAPSKPPEVKKVHMPGHPL